MRTMGASMNSTVIFLIDTSTIGLGPGDVAPACLATVSQGVSPDVHCTMFWAWRESMGPARSA